MRNVLIISLVLFALVACGGNEKTIREDTKINQSDTELLCLKELLNNVPSIRPYFEVNNEIPDLAVYPVIEKWIRLSDDEQDEFLISIGLRWHECYPDYSQPVTVYAKDLTGNIIRVLFVDPTGE